MPCRGFSMKRKGIIKPYFEVVDRDSYIVSIKLAIILGFMLGLINSLTLDTIINRILFIPIFMLTTIICCTVILYFLEYK